MKILDKRSLKLANSPSVSPRVEKSIFVVVLSFFVIFALGFQKVSEYKDFNPTVIVENHPFSNQQNKELLKGDKVIGEFVAENNHLGTISVKFNTGRYPVNYT